MHIANATDAQLFVNVWGNSSRAMRFRGFAAEGMDRCALIDERYGNHESAAEYREAAAVLRAA